MNIYGDETICCVCKFHADVIENNKHYCAECWFNKFSDIPFEEVDRQIKEHEKNKT